ncbi:MAG: hypothetical protein ACK422_05980, partial [Burkholderiales bacterium]
MNVFDVGFSAAWRLLPAGMLLASLAQAQSAGDLGSNRDAAGVVFPNADWIRFPALPRKSAPAPVTTPSATSNDNRTATRPAPTAAAPAGNNDWIQFPRLPPPVPKPATQPAATSATPTE